MNRILKKKQDNQFRNIQNFTLSDGPVEEISNISRFSATKMQL